MKKAIPSFSFSSATVKSPLFLPSYAAISKKLINSASFSFQFPTHNRLKPSEYPSKTLNEIASAPEPDLKPCAPHGVLGISKSAFERDHTTPELTTATPDPPPLGPYPNRGPDFPEPPMPSPPVPDIPMKPPRNPPPKPPDEVPPPTPADIVPPPQPPPPVPPHI